MKKIKYRLALDLGPTSIGWAVLLLDQSDPPAPKAIVRAGARIFSDGRNPKDGTSLAVTRRLARAMRRRRDRLLKRKARMMRLLQEHGFFPADEASRKALERLDPYVLRAKGLDEALQPGEFARALFHLNQRRGFKSNRRTDAKDSDTGLLKTAIADLRRQLAVLPDQPGDLLAWLAAHRPQSESAPARTVGELLWRRQKGGMGTRARYCKPQQLDDSGKSRLTKSYDLYIDRAMVLEEFTALYARQAQINPTIYTEVAREALLDCLKFQRPLRPVKPGRCTLLPDEPRAPLALPSQQRFRILQEVNHLRILQADQEDLSLTLEQRDRIVDALEHKGKCSFAQIRRLLELPGTTKFTLEDDRRTELKGNSTSAQMSHAKHFGSRWFDLGLPQQDSVVQRLLTVEIESDLIAGLEQEFGFDEERATAIARAGLPDGYGSLSAAALMRILPALTSEVMTYDKAVLAGGFAHHSHIAHAATGEILPELPYYGEYLQRHVGFADPEARPDDPPEKRFGRIPNPSVHIGLNQVCKVVNALIRRYGHPAEVVVEVARDLKRSWEQKKEDEKQRVKNQDRNERLRVQVAQVRGISGFSVRHADVQKLILWEELGSDVAERRCPYSGQQLSATMVLSDQVQIEHILPFSRTLDDSLNNKTVALRHANQLKKNMTPYEAREIFEAQGWSYEDILARADLMPKNKRYRFYPGGIERWLKDDKDFLARALNDTRYLSRVAREYVSLICPAGTRVIPGQTTALLRGKFGLNTILGSTGEKNRDDHRHHAVDACVIGVTDQRMLNQFAIASGAARSNGLDRLVEAMPLPWDTYREHVVRAVTGIWVSHKPDHGHEGALMDATAYGLRPDLSIVQKRRADGSDAREIKNLIRISEPGMTSRHGLDIEGHDRAYKGYVGGSNYCIEITIDAAGSWSGQVISTFEAYKIVNSAPDRKSGIERLRHPRLGQNGAPLVMRLMNGDMVRMPVEGAPQLLRLVTVSASGQMFFAPHNEANVDARNRDKKNIFAYVSKMPSSLQKIKAAAVSVSAIGEITAHFSGKS